jgi:hypothetical protein
MTNQPSMNDNVFDKTQYFNALDKKIYDILSRPNKENLTYDILDTDKTKTNKLIALQEKQRQMKVGEIWQVVIGNYHEFRDLGVGHETGLDLVSEKRKIIAELKTRTNTDNSSSKKTNLDKLALFKISHPDYKCIYANINADTEEKTLKGAIKTFTHNGVELEHHVGYEFLKFIFGEDVVEIINFIKNTIDKYT